MLKSSPKLGFYHIKEVSSIIQACKNKVIKEDYDNLIEKINKGNKRLFLQFK